MQPRAARKSFLPSSSSRALRLAAPAWPSWLATAALLALGVLRVLAGIEGLGGGAALALAVVLGAGAALLAWWRARPGAREARR